MQRDAIQIGGFLPPMVIGPLRLFPIDLLLALVFLLLLHLKRLTGSHYGVCRHESEELPLWIKNVTVSFPSTPTSPQQEGIRATDHSRGAQWKIRAGPKLKLVLENPHTN